MEVDLEMTGGVPARVKYSMAQDAVRGAIFIAKGDRGELTIINPVAPPQGNQITLKTADGAKEESIAGHTTYACQLRAFIAQIRGEKTFPTNAELISRNPSPVVKVFGTKRYRIFHACRV